MLRFAAVGALVEDTLGRCTQCGATHPATVLRCPDTDVMLLLAGRLLDGRFRLLECIGRGGMASVWLALNERVDRRVAIKLIRPDVARDEGLVARFRAEARAAGRIGNPNICDILDSGRSPIGPYIVMELLEGQSLGDLLAGGERLDPPLAVMIVREALRGLQAAHRAGIVHRDLKPENIFLHRPDGGPPMVKLMDFGVAKFTDGSGEARTEHGALLGTPEYMAPEQFRGAAFAEPRTDIWAIGAILYRALTGANAFGGPTVAATLLMVATEQPRPCTELAPETPRGLADIVDRCLQKDLARRFVDVAELDAALAPYDAPVRDTSVFDRVVARTPAPTEADEVATPSEAEHAGTSGSERTRRWSADDGAAARQVDVTPPPRGRVAAGIAIASLVGFAVWQLRTSPSDRDRGDRVVDALDDGAPNDPSADAGEDATSVPAAGPGAPSTLAVTGPAPSPTEMPGPAEAPAVEPATVVVRPAVPPPPPPTDEPVVIDEDTPKQTNDAPSEPPPPDPAGVVRVGRWVAPTKPGPSGTLRAAANFCEGLAASAHLGIRRWELPNPAVAAKFAEAGGLRKGRYWTSALWRGNAITIALPSGEKRSIAATDAKPRALCVARWP